WAGGCRRYASRPARSFRPTAAETYTTAGRDPRVLFSVRSAPPTPAPPPESRAAPAADRAQHREHRAPVRRERDGVAPGAADGIRPVGPPVTAQRHGLLAATAADGPRRRGRVPPPGGGGGRATVALLQQGPPHDLGSPLR